MEGYVIRQLTALLSLLLLWTRVMIGPIALKQSIVCDYNVDIVY